MTYKSTAIGLTSLTIIMLAIWSTVLSFMPDRPSGLTLTEQPDAYMEDVSAVFMDKFGKPKMKIITPKLVHYLSNDTSQLTEPKLTLYRKSPKPWYVSSHFARATHGIDNITFREDVIIHHPGDDKLPATLIKAPTILVHPNNETVETNEEIELTQPNLTVKATGMRADMNSGNIMLLSQAKGEFRPNAN